MFRQTQISTETPREFAVCFPPGTIFRAVGTMNAAARFTILVKNDGTTKTLRCDDKTWKDPAMWRAFDGLNAGTFAKNLAEWKNWTITVDVSTPKSWYSTAATSYRSLPDGASRDEIICTLNAAYAQVRNDWRSYLEQLQALYPFFKTIEEAPAGINVLLRMTTAGAQVQQAQPQEQPELLMPPPRVASASPPQETITLTRDQMNYIYTMASGRALTDDVWATVKLIANR